MSKPDFLCHFIMFSTTDIAFKLLKTEKLKKGVDKSF